MSNIFGNIRYLSRYNSVRELIQDKCVSAGKLVIVDEGNDVVSLYAIEKEKKSETYIDLDNGLYAFKAFTDNKSVDIGSYSTEEPVKVSVGGVEKGREFDKASFTDVFNAIFFPDVDISFDINLNLTTLFYLKGDEVMLTNVTVTEIQSEEIEYLELYINDELVRRDEIGLKRESYQFLINRPISDTSEVRVKLRTKNSYLDRSEKIVFDNPLYWGIVDEGFVVSSAAVQRLNRDVIEGDKFDINFTTNGTCVFLAVESNKQVIKVVDESMNSVLDNFSQGDVELIFGSESSVYNTYMSSVSSIDDFFLQFRFREVRRKI